MKNYLIIRKTVNEYISDNINTPEIKYESKDRGYAFEISPRSFRSEENIRDDIFIGAGSYLLLKDSGSIYAFGTTSEDMEVLDAQTEEDFLEKIKSQSYSIEPFATVTE